MKFIEALGLTTLVVALVGGLFYWIFHSFKKSFPDFKFWWKYKFLKKKYDEKDVDWLMDAMQKGYSEMQIHKILLIKGRSEKQAKEMLYIFKGIKKLQNRNRREEIKYGKRSEFIDGKIGKEQKYDEEEREFAREGRGERIARGGRY